MLSAPETRRQRLRRPPEGTGRPRSVLRLRPDNSSQRRSWFTFRKRLSTHAFRWYGSGRRRRVIAFVMMFVRGNCRLLTVVVAEPLCCMWPPAGLPCSAVLPVSSPGRPAVAPLSLSHLSPPPPPAHVLLSGLSSPHLCILVSGLEVITMKSQPALNKNIALAP